MNTQKKKIKDWLDNRKKAILDKEKKDKENELSATADMENKSILLTTGATERNSFKNIYDVAGNCWEWTTESNSSSHRVYRGRLLR